jgi:hypothetical protein
VPISNSMALARAKKLGYQLNAHPPQQLSGSSKVQTGK